MYCGAVVVDGVPTRVTPWMDIWAWGSFGTLSATRVPFHCPSAQSGPSLRRATAAAFCTNNEASETLIHLALREMQFPTH